MEERDAGRAGDEQQRREGRTCYDSPATYPIPPDPQQVATALVEIVWKSAICNDAWVHESSSWSHDR